MNVLVALKEFQLQRLADFYALTGIASDERPQPTLYTALYAFVAAQILLIVLTQKGRQIIFTTVDTVLAVVLVAILLAAILSLPIGAVYIGIRGSLLMARSLSENFPALGLVLKPLLAAVGQRVAAAAGGAGGGMEGAAGMAAAAGADGVPEPAL